MNFDIDYLNFRNVYCCAELVELAASSMADSEKSEYEPAVSALRDLAGRLYAAAGVRADVERFAERPLKAAQRVRTQAAQAAEQLETGAGGAKEAE